MVGALQVPDRRISTTELLFDQKRTLLDTHCWPPMYAAATIGNSSLHLIKWETCFGSHESENQ